MVKEKSFVKKILSFILCLVMIISGMIYYRGGMVKVTANGETNTTTETGGILCGINKDSNANWSTDCIFSYTKDGTNWSEINYTSQTYPITGVKAIKLTKPSNYTVASYSELNIWDSSNNGQTSPKISTIINDLTTTGYTLTDGYTYEINHIAFNDSSSSQSDSNSGENSNGGNSQNEPTSYKFNGTIYLTWVANNNNFYYHKITGLEEEVPTKLQTKNINEMTADNASSVTFAIGNDYEFCYAEFENLIDKTTDTTGNTYTDSNFNKASAAEKLLLLRELELTIDPTGAICTDNSISTNGDRAFRLTIFNENAKAFTVNGTGSYNINAEEGILTNSTVDLSTSTANAPAEVASFMLNNSVQITPANNIGSTTDIISIEALNVANSDAININGTGTVTFKSNFYNNVTFKVSDGTNSYYVKVNRYDMLISDSLVPGDESRIYANVYYSKSLKDKIKVQVRLVKYDGSIVIKDATLSSSAYLPNGDKVDSVNCVDASSNDPNNATNIDNASILMSTFYVDKANVRDAYFTVINADDGSVISGSGYGLRYNVATRKTIY